VVPLPIAVIVACVESLESGAIVTTEDDVVSQTMPAGSTMTLPLASRTVAVTALVAPIEAKRSESIDSVIDAGSCSTVTDAVSLSPAAETMIDVLPLPIDVTTPSGETDATPGTVEDHVSVAATSSAIRSRCRGSTTRLRARSSRWCPRRSGCRRPS
jgi:hypothetical protein